MHGEYSAQSVKFGLELNSDEKHQNKLENTVFKIISSTAWIEGKLGGIQEQSIFPERSKFNIASFIRKPKGKEEKNESPDKKDSTLFIYKGAIQKKKKLDC